MDLFGTTGQQRREWLEGILGRYIADPANRYLGPTGVPQRANNAMRLLEFTDAGDMPAAADAGRRLWNDPSIGNAAEYAAAGAAMMLPMYSARMGEGIADVAGDAARFWADESGALTLGKADPATERAQDILDLLTSGRAADVTDEMLDLGDPVANARLNMYLFDNYDLPMDEASRMARAGEMMPGEGYSGTTADFPAFSDGGWIAPDANTADFYATRARARDVLDDQADDMMFDYGEADAMNVDARDPYLILAEANAGPDGENIMHLRYTNRNLLDMRELGDAPYSDDLFSWLSGRGIVDAPSDTDELAEWFYDAGLDPSDRPTLWNVIESMGLERDMRSAGFDGFQIDDVVAGKIGSQSRATGHSSARLFDGSNIRSRFARFDPRLAHLRNLSAGLAGTGILAPALMQDDDR